MPSHSITTLSYTQWRRQNNFRNCQFSTGSTVPEFWPRDFIYVKWFMVHFWNIYCSTDTGFTSYWSSQIQNRCFIWACNVQSRFLTPCCIESGTHDVYSRWWYWYIVGDWHAPHSTEDSLYVLSKLANFYTNINHV